MTAPEDGPPWYHQHAYDVSLAVAARDAAVEVGDKEMAARFAIEARAAIASAVEAGVPLHELAGEIDYPDGAEALDGPHIDQQIADMQDNGRAFAVDRGRAGEAWESGARWLELTEVVVNGDTVLEVVHGTPDMVARWPEAPAADTDTGEGGVVGERLAAEVAALRERFTAARDEAVTRSGEDVGGEEYAVAARAPEVVQDVGQAWDLERGGGSEAGLGT